MLRRNGMCNAWAMEERVIQAEQGSAIPYILISLSPQHKTLNRSSLVPYGALHCGRYYITRYHGVMSHIIYWKIQISA